MPSTLCEKVKLTMHLPGGYSKVLVERTIPLNMGPGGICWDIPTETIPPHLRNIGSRFIVVATQSALPKDRSQVKPEEIRNATSITVEEIRDE